MGPSRGQLRWHTYRRSLAPAVPHHYGGLSRAPLSATATLHPQQGVRVQAVILCRGTPSARHSPWPVLSPIACSKRPGPLTSDSNSAAANSQPRSSLHHLLSSPPSPFRCYWSLLLLSLVTFILLSARQDAFRPSPLPIRLCSRCLSPTALCRADPRDRKPSHGSTTAITFSTAPWSRRTSPAGVPVAVLGRCLSFPSS